MWRKLRLVKKAEPKKGKVPSKRSTRGKMEGRSALRHFRRIFSLAEIIKCVPFEISSNGDLNVQLFQSTWKTLAWLLATLSLCINALFQIASFGMELRKMGMTAELSARLLYVLLTTTGTLFSVSVAYGRREFGAWINAIHKMSALGQEILDVPPYYTLYFVQGSAYYLSITSIYGLTIILVAFNLLMPNEPMHLSAIFAESYWENFGLVVSVLLKAAESAWLTTQISLVWICWEGSVFTTILVSRGIQKEVEKNGWVSLRVVGELYNQLQVLNVLHNNFNRPIFTWAFQTLCLCMITLFSYCSITLSPILPAGVQMAFISFAIFGIFIQTFFFGFICKMQIESMKAIQGMKRASLLIPKHADRLEAAARKRDVWAMRSCCSQVGFLAKHDLQHTSFVNEWTLSLLLILLSY